MPTIRYEKSTCDVCNTVQERELIPNTALAGWLSFTVADASDKRRRRDVAICPACARIIQIAINQQPSQESAPITMPDPAPAPERKHGKQGERKQEPQSAAAGPEPAMGRTA